MTRLRTSDFDYPLDPGYIAQEPPPRREAARLMVCRGGAAGVVHTVFDRIGDHLEDGTLLVLNDTKVFPARLAGRKAGTGGRVEVLLLRERGGGEWECLLKPGRRLPRGAEIEFEGSPLVGRVEDRLRGGAFAVRFRGTGEIEREIDRIGRVPLPPYIRRPPAGGRRAPCDDRERYQTVYARRRGAVAAPTAGLHFSVTLLERLAARGIATAALTLHVGPGTFLPVREEYVDDHRMHPEWYEIGEETAAKIARAREAATSASDAFASGASSSLRASIAFSSFFIRSPKAAFFSWAVLPSSLTRDSTLSRIAWTMASAGSPLVAAPASATPAPGVASGSG
ncbi:MAG TPA: S-adenosylmethionine:tRNA ribosyltransferase-isomerase, partial [bacterium]|nr:S-adenosylmethionine:tRNA ribosyltransferase-isomerase [bacterium]